MKEGDPFIRDTGHDIERAVLGRSEAFGEKEIQERLKRGISREEAFDLVKRPEFQPFEDPTNPKERPFIKDLHSDVSHALEIYFKQLSYYTAVDSPLDDYGMDAFFELEVGNGNYLRVTLDITTYTGDAVNPERADIMLDWPQDGIDKSSPEGKTVWDAKVREIADLVVQEFKFKAERENYSILALKQEEIENSKQLRDNKKATPRLSKKPGRGRILRPRRPRPDTKGE